MAEASAAVATSNQENQECSLEIIDLDELDLEFQDDETWLVSPTPELEKSPDQAISPSWRKWNMSDDPEVRMKKKSLVEKLDFIAKGSPTRGFYASRPSMSSTPIIPNKTSTQTSSPSKFDPRTFTRPLKNSSLRNLTFDKETTDMLANLSIDTKAIQGSDTDDTWKNSTFTRKMSRISRDSSEALDDDRVSLASSDASSSHRLNDVGDVQNLARLQEESLRQSQGLNSTFNKEVNSTFNKDVNSTFTKAGRGLNSTYQKSPPSNTDLGIGGGLNHHTSNNTTFEVIRDTGTIGNQTFSGGNGSNGTGSGNGSNQGIKTATSKDSRSSSQDIDLEDRLSSTSDSSMSHRLNDLGDVQHLARMQEESLRQAVMSNNHRSATVSPSSENSPSTEGCGMMPNDLQSEEGSYAGSHAHNHRNGGGGVGGGYAQYSSQDSLPDSPYSSQSLDSQPATDRIARSMPNLNKIRGQKKNSAGPPAGSKTGLGRGQHNYGLSSRHHNSDPRMVPGHPGSRQVQTGYNQQQNQGVPSRGTVLSRDSSTGSSSGIRQPMRYQSGIRPPSTATSRIARPSTTGIPRPGASRLPAPTSSGIPKPNSNPGSRAPSASGSRKSSYCY